MKIKFLCHSICESKIKDKVSEFFMLLFLIYDMAELKTKLEKLRTISHACLASLLKHEISDKDFNDQNGKIFRTSTNENEALSQYLTRKQPLVLNWIKKEKSIDKSRFYSDDKFTIIHTKIVLFELDISILKMLLLNIFDFEFSLHGEKNVKRSAKCSSSTHKTDKKCCSKCSTSGKTDHIEKDVYCKHCFVSKFLCKDGSFKCCSQCVNCVNCNKS